MKYCLYFLKEEKTTGCVRCIFCRKSDKCRDINIHKMGNWTIRFLGRFTFSWRGMISRLRLQNIWLRWEKYYQVDCSLLIIHWFIIFWDTIWSKQVTNSQRFSDKYKSLHSLHQPTYPLIKIDQNRITVCSKLVEKRNIAQWKTASEMHVAPRIVVHCCTLLSIVVNCCPLLSIVVHYYPLLTIVVNWCPLLSIVIHCCPLLTIVIHCCPLLSIFHCGYHRHCL